MAGIAATGGSTNGVLHLLAIAREAGRRPRRSTSWRRSAARDAGDREPRRRRAATSPRTLHRAGGTATVIARAGPRRAPRRRRADRRRRHARRGARASAPAPDGEVLVPRDAPFKPSGALHVLRGNLAPEGSVREARRHGAARQRGPARVFDSEEACAEAVRAGRVAAGRRARRALRGPGRRAGHARDAERHVVGGRRRARRVGRARHRRPLLRRDPRADGRPRRARRRPAAARSPPSGTATRSRSTSTPARSTSSSPTTSSPRGSPPGARPQLPYDFGVFAPLPRARRLRVRGRRAQA